MKIFKTILGVVLIYQAIALGLQLNLGVDPNSAMFNTISKITTLKVGVISIIGSCIYMILQMVLLKKINLKILSQLLIIFLSGFVLDFFNDYVYDNVSISNLALRITIYFSVILMKAIGVKMVLSSGIIETPLEALCLVIGNKINRKMGLIRQLCDVVFMIVTVTVTLITHNSWDLGIGTAMDLLLFGPTLIIIDYILNLVLKKKKLA